MDEPAVHTPSTISWGKHNETGFESFTGTFFVEILLFILTVFPTESERNCGGGCLAAAAAVAGGGALNVT